jgi:hypothetical protein
MIKNIRVFVMLIVSGLACNNMLSQSKTNQYPLPVIVYNENVKAPLTANEMAKIQEVYGEEAESLILSKPHRLISIKNILRNRVVYQQVNPGQTLKECPLLSSVPLFDYYVPNLTRDIVFHKDTFNPLKYSFSFNSTGAFMYKVDNTNYYIVIKSQHQ